MTVVICGIRVERRVGRNRGFLCRVRGRRRKGRRVTELGDRGDIVRSIMSLIHLLGVEAEIFEILKKRRERVVVVRVS